MGIYNNKLDNELFQQMATMKARGMTWEAIAPRLGRSAKELESLTWQRPKEWAKYLRIANSVVINEAMAESVISLRTVLREGNERMRVQASNSLVRLWNTQNPKTRKVKKKKEKELTPRQKYFRNKADEMAAMTNSEIAYQEMRDAEQLFVSRLAAYCQNDPELFAKVMDLADVDDRGQPKHSRSHDINDYIDEEIKKKLASTEAKNPEVYMTDDEYEQHMQAKEQQAEQEAMMTVPLPGRDASIVVKRGTPLDDADKQPKPKIDLAHGFTNTMPG